ncbi:MAG TPA: YigZ family protein [Candidatus Binatia bacterium]|nr:YigZ family protein [Candidatus Binatia bacterium]
MTSESKRYPVPAQETRVEMRVKNSRFIATLAPAFSVQAAREFVARVRQEFADASHNVPAFVVGYGAAVTAHCSDDGEPAGTAGRPALAVLQGSGLGDAALVVTRYYGGTKLGTGGLVRAYGDAARAVLEAAPRAQRTPTHTVQVTVPYALFESLRLLLAAHGSQTFDESFAAEVTVTARLAQERLPDFQEALRDMSNGTRQAQIVASEDDTLLPLS